MYSKLILLILLISGTYCHGQIPGGKWTGNYDQTILERVSKLEIDFKIINDSIITGRSHLYYPNNDYELHEIQGKVRKKDSTVYFEETLESTSVSNAAPVVYFMKLIDDGTQWRLQGFWKWKSATNTKYSRSNSVWLVQKKNVIVKAPKLKTPDKVKDIVTKRKVEPKPRTELKRPAETRSTQPVLRPKPDAISNPVVKRDQDQLKPVSEIKPAKEIKPQISNDVRLKKRSEVQSTITVKPEEKDSINVAIYDNGEIDNDSITIYFNDMLLKQQFRISAVPYFFRIALQTGRSNEIKIVAENMGSIPPNTALMIITTKSKRYEVRLSSNLEKNAVVRFKVE